jgi:hypothetical protein
MAAAKDLCVAPDVPIFGFRSLDGLVIKGVRAGRGKIGPVHGYMSEFDSFSFPGGGALVLYAMSGEAMTSSTGVLAVGLTVHPAGLTVSFPIGQPPTPPSAFQYTTPEVATVSCQPAGGGTVAVGSSCYLYTTVAGSQAAHVIECSGDPLP